MCDLSCIIWYLPLDNLPYACVTIYQNLPTVHVFTIFINTISIPFSLPLSRPLLFNIVVITLSPFEIYYQDTVVTTIKKGGHH